MRVEWKCCGFVADTECILSFKADRLEVGLRGFGVRKRYTVPCISTGSSKRSRSTRARRASLLHVIAGYSVPIRPHMFGSFWMDKFDKSSCIQLFLQFGQGSI